MKYDTAIIGAGPAGLFCAYELSKNTDLKILLIDAGPRFEQKHCNYLSTGICTHCKVCCNLSGFGGAAFFNPGKLSLFPAGSGLLDVTGSEEKCKRYYLRAINILNKYGIDIKEEYRTAHIPGLNSNDDCISIKYYNSCPISKKVMHTFANNMQEYLSNHISILSNTTIFSINRDHDDYWNLYSQNNETIETRNLVIAVGEFGYNWWHTISNSLGVSQSFSCIDIGFRLEFPSSDIKSYWDYHKDLKVLAKAPDGSEIRTYCVLKNGLVVPCFYGDYTVLDGVSNSSSKNAGMTIFNRVSERALCKDKILFANEYLKKFYQKYNAPQICSVNEFLDRKKQIDFAFPNQIYNNLCWGLEKIAEYLNISFNSNTILHVPVIDNLWRKSITDKHFQTNLKKLYVIGDASGIARGILQACVSGIVASDGIQGDE